MDLETTLAADFWAPGFINGKIQTRCKHVWDVATSEAGDRTSERSVWVFSSPKYKLKSLKKCGFWQPDSEPRGLMRQIVSHICKYGNKNYTVYPPPVLTSQNSTASFPNNTVTPHFFQPKYPEVETTVSFSLPFIIITHSLPLGNTKEECFAMIVQKGAPACCMWVRGSSHPSGTAERMGEVGVQWNTEQRSYLMGEAR